MAPHALLTFTCFSIAVNNVVLPVQEEAAVAHGAKKRRWTGELRRKILASVRPERVKQAVKDEGDVVDVEKQRAVPERKAAVKQVTTTQRLRPALKRGGRSPRAVGAPEAVAVAGIRDRKGVTVHFDLPAEDTYTSAPPVKPRFPTGVLGQPPESFRHSGPEMTAAFLTTSLTADAVSARAIDIDHELVARWTERKEACSRRRRYLRDHRPFRTEDDKEGEENAPVPTQPAESCHAEEVPPRVKTGLQFESPESEDEFVKAIRSRYLLKDDFLQRLESRMATREGPAAVREVKAS